VTSALPRMEVVAASEPLPARVARLLLDYLLAGHVPPGGRLPSERHLAEELGVGRSVVREALKTLSLLGLVEVRHGDGTFLRSVESGLLPSVIEWGLLLGERRTADLVEARQHLEAVTAQLAAARRTDSDLVALKDALVGMRSAGPDIEAFVAADVAFHLAVAEAAGNSVLSDVLRNIQSLLRVWITRVIHAAGDSGPSCQEHVPVYEAIVRRDPIAAGAAMRAHLDGAARRLRSALNEERPA
jgi:GntR family transcriptional regulator, transcriptional repressor for pyruvate dehydrogenase complex